jgi:hypothetical protein
MLADSKTANIRPIFVKLVPDERPHKKRLFALGERLSRWKCLKFCEIINETLELVTKSKFKATTVERKYFQNRVLRRSDKVFSAGTILIVRLIYVKKR